MLQKQLVHIHFHFQTNMKFPEKHTIQLLEHQNITNQNPWYDDIGGEGFTSVNTRLYPDTWISFYFISCKNARYANKK